jgi:F0F1-type ATP synthase assembly protein I
MWNSPAFGLVGIGFFLTASIVGMTFVGSLLDEHFETKPAFTLVLLALGLLVGFVGAYRQLMEVVARSSSPRARRGGRDGDAPSEDDRE